MDKGMTEGATDKGRWLAPRMLLWVRSEEEVVRR